MDADDTTPNLGKPQEEYQMSTKAIIAPSATSVKAAEAWLRRVARIVRAEAPEMTHLEITLRRYVAVQEVREQSGSGYAITYRPDESCLDLAFSRALDWFEVDALSSVHGAEPVRIKMHELSLPPMPTGACFDLSGFERVAGPVSLATFASSELEISEILKPGKL